MSNPSVVYFVCAGQGDIKCCLHEHFLFQLPSQIGLISKYCSPCKRSRIQKEALTLKDSPVEISMFPVPRSQLVPFCSRFPAGRTSRSWRRTTPAASAGFTRNASRLFTLRSSPTAWGTELSSSCRYRDPAGFYTQPQTSTWNKNTDLYLHWSSVSGITRKLTSR